MDGPRAARAFLGVSTRKPVAAIYPAYVSSSRLVALMSSADRRPITNTGYCPVCKAGLADPGPTYNAITPSIALANRRRVCCAAQPAGTLAGADVIVVVAVLGRLPWFGRQDHLFAPTCEVQTAARRGGQGRRLRPRRQRGGVIRRKHSATLFAVGTFVMARSLSADHGRLGTPVGLGARHHRPGDARHLVGQCDNHNVDRSPLQQLRDPR